MAGETSAPGAWNTEGNEEVSASRAVQQGLVADQGTARIRARLDLALAEMLAMPSVLTFIEAYRHKPEARMTFIVDTGDGKPGSAEDSRCDGCNAVHLEGLHSLAVRRFRVTAYGLKPIDATEEAFQTFPFPVLALVLGLCETCHEAEVTR